jgi:protoporphyrinogen oxidase
MVSTPVKALSCGGSSEQDRFHLDLVTREGPKSLGVDGVISALPSYALAGLSKDWPEGVGEFLRGIPHAPLGLAYLSFPKDSAGSGFGGEGLLPQGRAGEDILSCFLPSRMVPDRCPPGLELLRVLFGGARKPHLARLDDAQSENLAARAAKRMLGLRRVPQLVKILRHERGLPQLLVGHLAALARSRASLAVEWPGFVLAGTSMQGPGIENAAASGRAGADEMAHFFIAGTGGREANHA